MSKRNPILVWGMLLFFLHSCNETTDPSITFQELNDQQIQDYIRDQGLDADSTESGLFYVIKQPSNGDSARTGDSVYVHFQASLISGTVVDSTSPALDRPDGHLLGVTLLLDGFDEGIRLMKEGEHVTLIIPSYLAYGGNPPAILRNLPPYSVLLYDITLVDVVPEIEQVEDYFRDSSFVASQTIGDSLFFRLDQPGSPDTKLADDDQATVVYTGRLLNGFQFDSNQDSSFNFVLGADQVVDGFEEAVKLMNEGDKATVIFLSSLGYADIGSAPSIAPYTPLLFELNLVKSNATQIAEFLVSQGSPSDTLSTESGVIYRRLAIGSGATPTINNEVTLTNFRSYYLDSLNRQIEFDAGNTTRSLNLASNPTDEPSLNQGLVDVITQLNVGDEVLILMEFAEGFGVNGRLDAPGRVPLIYEFRLETINN